MSIPDQSGFQPVFTLGADARGRLLYPTHRVGPQRFWASRKTRARRYNGQTAFRRAPDAQDQVIDWIAARIAQAPPQAKIRLLVVAGSIGCEAYTYAMLAENAGLFAGERLKIESVDISDAFTRYARRAEYPVEALRGLEPQLTQHFTVAASGVARVNADIRDRVRILPHCSLARFQPGTAYDVVVASNLLKHIHNNLMAYKPRYEHARQSRQAAAIGQLCALTSNLLFVDMIEETPFASHFKKAPFNPFAEAGMVYLDADLKPCGGTGAYPTTGLEASACIEHRDYVHALQKYAACPAVLGV
ncbi:MAG: hypothetical protein H6865_08365 [Rhodospirillales bacterium]|nr:hypothetical protein [Alphaproteobacteria bacterium]MCB9987628.1 hypothetical protein [Rhodospirillales bacterium]USO08073.1 MAG: hypothetical protein H6866_02310 [Rhodospirillales bacterium]